MKISALVAASSLLAPAIVNARPGSLNEDLTIPTNINAPSPTTTNERRQATQSHVVTTGASGRTFPRFEIRQLKSQHSYQWSLFILAMQSFQNADPNDPTSYYQLSTIHGVPQQDWNNVTSCDGCSNNEGYCTHSLILFPSWHRAYMALFEQAFIAAAKQIAATYPSSTRATYQAAAAQIRFPYFDWAAKPSPGTDAIPDLITATNVTVTGPNGQVTIPNPLYSYKLPHTYDLVYENWIAWQETLRYPSTADPYATTQESLVTGAFNTTQPTLQDQVYHLFTACDDYLHFSNDQAGNSATQCSNSLEGIHNTVHTIAGGYGYNGGPGGHMTYLNVAAFDPLFWLHHMNVDRIFAMWQTLHPNSYGGSQQASIGTWTISPGSIQNETSPLKPFRKDSNDNYWTTNDVQNWATTFHYTYPEYVDSKGDKRAIASYVNQLYGPSATATAGSSKRTAASTDSMSMSNSPRAVDPLSHNNGSKIEYVANVHSPRFLLNGSYSIYLFNGAPSTESPSSWLSDSRLISPIGVTSMPDMQQKLIVANSVPLTRALRAIHADGALPDLHLNHVVPYLREKLQWRIVGPNGTAVAPENVDGFQVGVFASSTSKPASIFELPTWSPFVPLVEVTEGKLGGATADSTIFAPAERINN